MQLQLATFLTFMKTKLVGIALELESEYLFCEYSNHIRKKKELKEKFWIH